MSNELLLPIYIENSSYFNKSNIIKLFEITFLHIIFIIGDVYFSINNCNSPDVIINLTGYFALYASIETIWVINLIIQKKNTTLTCSCDTYILIIYNLFIVVWNMLGVFILSELIDYDCNIEIYNYLFAKIIINYFYCIYKIIAICYE